MSVEVSHIEWYAASWKMDFGKQIDKHETSDTANNNQQAVTQEIMDTNNEKAVQKETKNQNGDTNDVTPSSSDFSNNTTWVITNITKYYQYYQILPKYYQYGG